MEEKTTVTGSAKYMRLLKDKLAFIGKGMKNTFLYFPVTQGSIWLFTLLCTILVSCSDSVVMDFGEKLMYFLIFYGTGSFFAEALYQKNGKPWLRFSLYAVFILPAVLFTRLLSLKYGTMVFGWDYDSVQSVLPRYIACYELVLFILAFYFCFRKTRFSLEAYFVRFFAWAVRISIMYFVLIVGVSMVLGIFVELFEADFEIYIQAQVLLFGIFYVSSLLRGILPGKGEDGRFTEALIKYVLTGLVVSAFAIIYVYILKIVLFRDMPSNAVFRILSGLFLAGLPIWTMNSFYTQRNPLLKISRILPYLFSPLILLQAYSIGIRIYENGITPMRYICVMLLVFEILYITLYYFRRQAVGWLFLAAAGFVFTACCMPGINMYRISFLDQKGAIQKVMTAADPSLLSQRERDKAAGAYWYLKEDMPGNSYLAGLTAEEEEMLQSVKGEAFPDYHDTFDFYQTEYITALDVSGYRYCYPVQDSCRSGTDTALLTEYPFSYGGGKSITFNLKEYLDGFLGKENYEDENGEYFRANQEIMINTRIKLYLEYLSFDYDLVTKEYTHISLRGYLLEK